MGKHCQVIMGPAGVGKSTYCHVIQQHCQNKGRTVHVINLDPAADGFAYSCAVDVRNLITLEDVMEVCGASGSGLDVDDHLESRKMHCQCISKQAVCGMISPRK